MISIDLLPPEFRKAERTAPAILFATLGLVALFCTCLAGGAYAWFGVVGSAKNAVDMAQEVQDSKEPQATYCDRLQKEKKEYTARMDHIKNFSDSRILWTKKIDQLASIIDSPPEQDRHMVWLQTLIVKMDGGRDQGLSLKGKSATGFLNKLSYFNSDLKTGPFFDEFTSISVPAGKVGHDEAFEPASAWQFEAALGIEDPNDKSKQKPAAKPAVKQK